MCHEQLQPALEGFSYLTEIQIWRRRMKYEGVVEYLRNFDVNERDMTKYIIGTISNIDQPMTPSSKR